MEYKHIIVETSENVGIITLNRGSVLNAVNEGMLSETAHQLGVFDSDTSIGAVVLKGQEKAFAAGIDIFELQQKQKQGGFVLGDYYKSFALIEGFSKPLIAAVSGYALGIGLELAMCADIILAADNARFGQPEISLGIIPGFGATQKLCQTIGRAKTSEMVLSGAGDECPGSRRIRTHQPDCSAGGLGKGKHQGSPANSVNAPNRRRNGQRRPDASV